MKISFKILLVFSLTWYNQLISQTVNQDLKLEIKKLLPWEKETGGWYPEGEAEVAAGNDLFLLIDGGAAIYQEYGFRQTIHQTYHNHTGKSINLEIYEMNSGESAYGMFTFKRSEDGIPVSLGQEGWLESYYLNFWEGPFLVTIIGLDTDSTTLQGIQSIGRAVDYRIENHGNKPEIISCLPVENLQSPGIVYLKGNLALFNQYIFDSRDIFNLQEGVRGIYRDYSLFIFQYPDQNEAKNWYVFAMGTLINSNRFTFLSEQNHSFEIKDHKDTAIRIKYFQRWILIVLGKPDLKFDHLLNQLEINLSP